MTAVAYMQTMRIMGRMRMILVAVAMLIGCMDGGDEDLGEHQSEAGNPYRKCSAICGGSQIIHIRIGNTDSYSCNVTGGPHDSPTPEICDITP